mgnify:CR=1 FL=1
MILYKRIVCDNDTHWIDLIVDIVNNVTHMYVHSTYNKYNPSVCTFNIQ